MMDVHYKYLGQWPYISRLLLDKLEDYAVEQGAEIVNSNNISYIRNDYFATEPVPTRHGQFWQNAVHFLYKNVFYSYYIEDNPLFEFHFRKTPAINRSFYSVDNIVDETQYDWVYELWKDINLIPSVVVTIWNNLILSKNSKPNSSDKLYRLVEVNNKLIVEEVLDD